MNSPAAAPRVRPADAADLPAIAELFTASIHGLAGAHYDAAQRRAWAPRPPDLDAWRQRLAPLHTLIADVGGRLCGFVSCTGDGHIDLLYTAPEQARRGVASLLLQHAEAHMRACGAAAFHTEASLVAQPFFARHGYVVVEEQFVQRQGVGFRRYAMRKVCAAPLSEQAAQRSSRASAAWIS